MEFEWNEKKCNYSAQRLAVLILPQIAQIRADFIHRLK